mmetsp:Transcript_20073/g.55878  ORF Transcript_20073/g.55878 Transcript_20073/m.55878 type:complete len:136 (-) Transcript_20073:395-802(-)
MAYSSGSEHMGTSRSAKVSSNPCQLFWSVLVVLPPLRRYTPRLSCASESMAVDSIQTSLTCMVSSKWQTASRFVRCVYMPHTTNALNNVAQDRKRYVGVTTSTNTPQGDTKRHNLINCLFRFRLIEHRTTQPPRP